MLKFNKVKVTTRAILSEPIEFPNLLTEANLSEFDYHGFQISELEKEYYNRNEVELVSSPTTYSNMNFTNRWPVKQPWAYIEVKNPNLFINQSFLYTRYMFGNRANYELQKFCKYNPELFKLLELRPKWSLTLQLEWFNEKGRFELLNFKRDYKEPSLINNDIKTIQEMLAPFKWDIDCKMLADNFDEWKNLNPEDQDTYKKRYFGLDYV